MAFITDNYEQGLEFIETLTDGDMDRLASYDDRAIVQLLDTSIENFLPQQSKMIKYFKRYTGSSVPIKSRTYPVYIKEDEKVELHNNFEGEIVDTKTSYLFSNPVIRRLQNDNEAMDAEVKDFDMNNRITDMDAEMSKMAGITGYGASLMYISKKPGQMERLMKLNPWETIFVNDDVGDLAWAIRCWTEVNLNKETIYKIELYDGVNIIYFDGSKISGSYKITGVQPHGFGIIPIFQAKNNEELRSDIDAVVDLIDAYDIGISDLSNELLNTRNAKLISENADIDLKTIQDSEITGALNLPEGAKLYYLIKELKNDAYMVYYEKLEDNIARFSGTPDFTNIEKTGNLTNLGISFLYSKLDQRAGAFKRKYVSYLQDVYQCLQTSLTTRGKSLDYKQIDYLWTEQKPYNEKENAEIQEKLMGKVSDVTRLSKDPGIDNPEKEKENWKADMKENAAIESAAFNIGNGSENTNEGDE